jgi:hypothetical protein
MVEVTALEFALCDRVLTQLKVREDRNRQLQAPGAMLNDGLVCLLFRRIALHIWPGLLMQSMKIFTCKVLCNYYILAAKGVESIGLGVTVHKPNGWLSHRLTDRKA